MVWGAGKILFKRRVSIGLMSHGQRWNLRKCASFSCQLQVDAARVSHFWDAETCEFSQVPSLSMGIHGTLMDTLISLLLINIVGQASLDDK